MIVNARNIKRMLENAKHMKPYETFFRYYHKKGTIRYNVNYELVDEIRTWRKQCKQGQITINLKNNLTMMIEKIPYYILVIESAENNWMFDPVGLGFDKEFIIHGIIYVFKKEKDRDTVFNYINCKN
jgi:hypothetical protein